MANINSNDKWYFTKEQLENTPSRKCGYDSHKELSYRQQAANFIQDMGQRLKVNQLCINTAIVYMHRFYVFHSFTHFPWHQMAAAALFLAAKVEEQPRKLEYVIRVANICRNSRDTNIDINSERYITQSQDLVFNENVLLQTLGFDVAIDHPHTHVVRCCHLVRASKDLAQSSYFMASNSLHLTTMCIQYKPTVVACFCILVACKWSNWEIPLSNEKKEWYSYVDPTVTAELLQQLTEEFLVIFEACPSRLKEKIMAIADVSHTPVPHMNSPFDTDPKKVIREDGKDPHLHRSAHDSKAGSDDPHKHRSSRPHEPGSSNQQQREREYKERKERERMAAQQKALMSGQKVPHGGHHRPMVDPKLKPHPRAPSSGYPTAGRPEPRDHLREATRDSPFGLATKDSGREHGKDVSASKELQKREHLAKTGLQGENSSGGYADSRLGYNSLSEKQRLDANSRTRVDPSSKVPSVRPNATAGHEKGNPYLNKPPTSTSQKTKSPFNADASKSVPKTNQISGAHKQPHHHHHHQQHHNDAGSYNTTTNNDKGHFKEETRLSHAVKKPSMFSPEKTPPHRKSVTSPNLSLVKSEPASLIGPLSPLTSPASIRSRNYSGSSEPELRPVMKKIDQIEGFENLMRDNTIGINNVHHQTPAVVIKKEHDLKPPLSAVDNKTKLGNDLETDPILISNLLKEAPPVPNYPIVAGAVVKAEPILPSVTVAESTTKPAPNTQQQTETKDREHHHHKSKKKNKEKHKHKDKEKSREEKEKKKKHKDKDREKYRHKDNGQQQPLVAEPIKIKIHKDKIQPMPESSTNQSLGLKIKIPKEKIKTENINELQLHQQQPTQPPRGELKIKIPKDIINSCNSAATDGGNKKRVRDPHQSDAPPCKLAKSSHRDAKQNGRHSYNSKVSSNDCNVRSSVPFPSGRFAHHNQPQPHTTATANALQPHLAAPGPAYPHHQHQQHPVYYYPPPPPPSLPNMSMPPPTMYMYPDAGQYYHHQGYVQYADVYGRPQAAAMPHVGAGTGTGTTQQPPLPRDAPQNVPPPPPPE